MSWLRPVTHVLPMTEWRHHRVLPVPGRVLVQRPGALVKPGDPVAEAVLQPRHRLIDVARMLGVPREQADAFIRVEEGERLERGDVLAERRGLFRRVVRTPVDGEVVMVGEGQVLLREETQPFTLVAGVPGRVTEVLPGRGVEITATVALVDGVWGNGHVGYGVMQVLTDTPGEELIPDRIVPPLRGSVVLGGFCRDPEVLQRAAELPLRGLILSSLRARLIPVVESLSLPVVVVEGFGHLPMNERAFKLLVSYNQREVGLLAEPMQRRTGVRPRVLVPLDVSAAPPAGEADEVRRGQTVRMLRAPYAGQIGTVVGVRPGWTAFPNGVRARAVEVRLEDGARAVVPLNNLEILA